jgi:hypothetical protein
MCFRSKINFYIVLTKTTKVTPDFVSEPLVLGRKYSLKNLKVADDNYEFFSKINTTFKRIGGMYDSIDTGRTRSNTCEFRTILTKNKYNVSHVGFGYNYYVSDSIYNCSIARSIQSKYAINYTGWKIRFIGKHSKVFFVRW